MIHRRYLTTAEELKCPYLQHNNNIEDKGFVKFIKRAVEPAMDYLKTGIECLDFGCGPTPTVSILVERNGLRCDDYDPLFFPELSDKLYNAIFATKCFEHFYNPEKEIEIITSHLKENGYLIIMTKLLTEDDDFSTWH